MSKTTTTAKIQSDGTVVEVLADGSEQPLPTSSPRPMTAAEIEVAAKSDPDARPMSEEELRTARRIPRVKTMRRALGITQEEFATRYHVPLGTLRDWEQGRRQPDAPARNLLRVIDYAPETVERALEQGETL